MRPQLKEHAREAIEDFIRQKVEESGGNGVVLGLSGGLDSATVSKLCCDAIGPDKVLNIFMPSATSSAKDLHDAEELCRLTGAELRVIDICPVVNAFGSILPGMDQKGMAGNVMARCRMVVLFHHARLTGRVVMGTSNKSELLIGYFTKFGDGGSDFCPLGDLYKTEVRQLARQIGVPGPSSTSRPPPGCGPDRPTRPTWAQRMTSWTRCSSASRGTLTTRRSQPKPRSRSIRWRGSAPCIDAACTRGRCP